VTTGCATVLGGNLLPVVGATNEHAIRLIGDRSILSPQDSIPGLAAIYPSSLGGAAWAQIHLVNSDLRTQLHEPTARRGGWRTESQVVRIWDTGDSRVGVS
jgi:hypothetical protein